MLMETRTPVSRNMSPPSRAFDPAPRPGLSLADFRKVNRNGFGDPLNAYPHSMAWFKDRLFVGTTRSNLCMLKVSKVRTNLRHWPVECPDNLYDLDMRAHIWQFDPVADKWHRCFRSPMLSHTEAEPLPRDLGYRAMTVFQGDSDPEPALYVGTYAPARGAGAHILRSLDGKTFTPVQTPDSFGETVTTLRLLVPFKGRLFTAPAGRPKGNPNTPGKSVIYETRDPVKGEWVPICESGFGNPANVSVFEMIAFGDYLYAGTGNLAGGEVWRTRATGNPPYKWERVIEQGAYRGSTNQGAASLCVFNNALYVGTGIQHGGIDLANNVGPAAPELFRIHPDGDWDLIVGQPRDTPNGHKQPKSGLFPGFGNMFNGYFWRIAAHDGWLYLGTFDWSLMLYYADQSKWPDTFRRIANRVGLDTIFDHQAGADLYRSADGENWIPVTLNGFDNPYNYGIRGLQSTPFGLAVGTVNPFAPRVAKLDEDGWRYDNNPKGGLEIWLGTKAPNGSSGNPKETNRNAPANR